jgi:hypothetical protein
VRERIAERLIENPSLTVAWRFIIAEAGNEKHRGKIYWFFWNTDAVSSLQNRLDRDSVWDAVLDRLTESGVLFRTQRTDADA